MLPDLTPRRLLVAVIYVRVVFVEASPVVVRRLIDVFRCLPAANGPNADASIKGRSLP